MKNLNKLAFSSMLLIALTLISCREVSLNAIDEKIEQQGIEAKFTSDEYEAMIGFIEKIFKENPQYDPSNDAQMEQFGDDFGKCFTYMMVLGLAKDNGYLSSAQIKEIDEIQQIAAKQANNSGLDYSTTYEAKEAEPNDETLGESKRLIVDLNGNIIGDYIGETDTEYIGFAQDEFRVSKSDHNLIEFNREQGEGVVFCKEPGDIVKVYSLPSLNASVIGNMIYEEGSLPQTYECIGKQLNWYKIRFNHKTGYVLDDSVEWSAEDYF